MRNLAQFRLSDCTIWQRSPVQINGDWEKNYKETVLTLSRALVLFCLLIWTAARENSLFPSLSSPLAFLSVISTRSFPGQSVCLFWALHITLCPESILKSYHCKTNRKQVSNKYSLINILSSCTDTKMLKLELWKQHWVLNTRLAGERFFCTAHSQNSVSSTYFRIFSFSCISKRNSLLSCPGVFPSQTENLTLLSLSFPQWSKITGASLLNLYRFQLHVAASMQFPNSLSAPFLTSPHLNWRL